MKANTHNHGEKQRSDLREIPTWARRYAQNRTLPMLGSLVIVAVGCAAYAALSYLMTWAWLTGQRALAVAVLLVMAGFAAWWMWVTIVGGPRIVRRIIQRLYRSEGAVSPGPFPEENTWWQSPVVASVFGSCVITTVALVMLEVLPIRYMQPISALYIIPLFVYVGISHGGARSRFMGLWPALYGIHAILLVAGAPICFTGPWETLNIFVPVIGYGVIAALAAHIYSRYALRRLRRLARTPETPDQSIEGGG